jgi:hypothetical protein
VQQPAQQQPEENKDKEGKKGNKKIFVIGGIAALLVVFVVLIITLGGRSKAKKLAAEKQAKDIQTAADISDAVTSVISSGSVRDDMKPYFGSLISIDGDMEYLPQSFQKAFESEMGEIPEQQYTKGGASGYSFRIDESGNNVTVYISTASKADEWQAYPDTDESYYAGKTSGETADETAGNCSFAKLISEDSPILGYWQSDNAGMYIGYNTTDADEGLSIWLYTSDKWIQMMSTKYKFYASGQQYELSGDTGFLAYVSSTDDVEFTITDDDHITVNFQSDNYTGSNDGGDAYISDYEFTRGSISEDMFDEIGGNWIIEYVAGLGVGTSLEVTYSDDTYHYTETDSSGAEFSCVHDKTTDESGNVTMPVIVMYDGVDGVVFLNPTIDIDDDGADFIGFAYREFTTYENDGDKLLYDCGYCGGGGIEAYLYREGSERYDTLVMIKAYQEFISEDDPDAVAYYMGYLDDDDIPEVFVCNSTVPAYTQGQHIYSMKDGVVTDMSDFEIGEYGYLDYYEKNGVVKSWYNGYGDYYGYYYILTNGKLETWHVVEIINVEEPDDWSCYVDGEAVDTDTYKSFVQNLTADIDDSLIDIGPGEADSVYAAYENLMQ